MVLMMPLGFEVANLKTSTDLFLSFSFDYLFFINRMSSILEMV